MYVFRADPNGGGWLPSLLRLAKTREGRLALIEALSSRSAAGSEGPTPGDLHKAGSANPAPALAIVRTSDRPETREGSKPPPDGKARHG
jgi:hypothetical protein